ncbi:hypothetical protein PanWU01x14_344570 [Parasponia andersonii]|uniref:Disease resistance N-terminal domain-containing protein n=1 Tax=Parasponia andersonii TaxID=3476 RepID=A0A2P5AD06_PARAD|nr:hypothetical protein PanWU01x14_344570 [Parasponia andersonii]
MALEFMGGALLSASLQALFERLSSGEVLAYLQGKSTRSCDFVELVGKPKLVLNSMTAVLDDAEQKQIRNKPGVEAWLDELQDAVYEADDILDEIEYDALQLKVEADQSRGSSSKVRNLFKKIERPSNFFSRSHSSNSGDMKRKIKNILARFEDIAKQKDLLDLKKVTLRQKTSQRIPSTSLPDETEVYGRDGNKDVVRKVLLSNDNLS